MAGKIRKVCLDTDIIIDYLKETEETNDLIKKLYLKFDEIITTAVTSYELLVGVEYMQGKDRVKVENILNDIDVLPFSKEVSLESAKVSAELKKSGKQIGIADLLIAGICIYTGSCLLTKNIEHFSRIKNLQILELNQL